MKKQICGPRLSPSIPTQPRKDSPARCSNDQFYSQLSQGFAFFNMEITRNLADSGLCGYYVKRDGVTTRYKSLDEVSMALDARWQEWGQK